MSNPDRVIGIAVMSYNGQMSSGINADYDAIPDPESLAGYLRDAVDALVRAAKSAGRRPTAATHAGEADSSKPGGARRASRSGRLRVVKTE